MTTNPLFTTIVHTYNRPAFLKTAVEALQRQTYTNLEIILINNGATPDTIEYLHEVAAADDRIKLVNFKENQFSWDDPSKYIAICWNAALKESTGEYVWIQEDDDFLAEDYVEKMVVLFRENPECTTVAGMPISVDADGKVNEFQVRDSNGRPRYSSGRDVALDYLSGSIKLFSAPGTIFSFKRDELMAAGGYHKAADSSHIFGIVPFGITGFDSTALFHWRHHEGQVNKQLTSNGWIGVDYSLSLVKDWQLEKRWSVFGAKTARDMVSTYEKRTYDSAARCYVTSIYSLSFMNSFRIARKMWSIPYFWARVVTHLLERRFYIQAVAPVIKPPLKALFRLVPGLGKLTPRLSAKADRWT